MQGLSDLARLSKGFKSTSDSECNKPVLLLWVGALAYMAYKVTCRCVAVDSLCFVLSALNKIYNFNKDCPMKVDRGQNVRVVVSLLRFVISVR